MEIKELQEMVAAHTVKVPQTVHEAYSRLLDEVKELDQAIKNETIEDVGYEIYDCIYFLVHIANLSGIELSGAIDKKIKYNQERYKD